MRKFITFFLLIPFFVQPVYAAKPTPTPKPVVKSVCLDPGHGGTDPGAVYGGMSESNLNLSVGLNLRDRLVTDGYKVYMTRTTDVNLSNEERYNYCNGTDARLVVSIHQNASTNSSVDYTEVLYAKHSDKSLAANTAGIIGSALGLSSTSTNFADGVLLKTTAPAILTEALFMSSSNETTDLQTGTRLNGEASAIESAINSYFGN